MNLLLIREPRSDYTPGKLFIEDQEFCFTLEDQDRQLESGGRKVYGETCIPRGTYPVVLDFSARFRQTMPHLLGVPQFDGIRIHPGNTVEATHGCVLVGERRAANTIQNSRVAYMRLMNALTPVFDRKETILMEVV